MADDSKMKFLDNVPAQNAFGFSNGRTANNLEELYNILKDSDDKIFSEHVNNEKNDFANWIKYCIFHTSLADKLAMIKSRDEFLKILGGEISAIKNPAAPLNASDSQNTPIASPVVVPVATPIVVNQSPVVVPVASAVTPVVVEESFGFEDVFSALIEDLAQEIFTWDAQS
jgi:hypothetical protein